MVHMARNDPIPVAAPNTEPNSTKRSETPFPLHPLAHGIQPIAVQQKVAAVVDHRFRGKIRFRYAANEILPRFYTEPRERRWANRGS